MFFAPALFQRLSLGILFVLSVGLPDCMIYILPFCLSLISVSGNKAYFGIELALSFLLLFFFSFIFHALFTY